MGLGSPRVPRLFLMCDYALVSSRVAAALCAWVSWASIGPEGAYFMKKYEAIYIVPAALSDDEVQKVADNFKSVVEKNGGTVESAGKWEKRKLAYEIDDHKDGNYILMMFEAPSTVPAELSRLLGINDAVIRHRIYLREN